MHMISNNVHRRNVKILHWNANGLTNFANCQQLGHLLEKENIQVASLNETFFKENHNPFFHNYYLYRNDRVHARGGGVALLVHRSLKHKLLPLTATISTENLSVEVVINHRNVIITTAYSPRYSCNFSADMTKLTPTSKEFILLGDLNAKHTSWNCSQNNLSGIILNNLQQTNNFFIYSPSSPTLYPHQRNCSSSVVDIVLSNCPMRMRLSTLEYEIPSDHRPIICSMDCTSINIVDSTYFTYKNTDWLRFQHVINSSITLRVESYTSKSAIDREINQFVELILNARELSTPKSNHVSKTDLPSDVLRLIGQRKMYKRKFQRAGNTYQHSFYMQCIKFLTGYIHKRLNKERNLKWSNLLTKLKPGDKRF